ncbi:MAG: phosphonate ABC transporter, permease protein PhnE [Acidimicrobiia bacterium]|nr:phosphonate ABC transporter, permease protein PhnE [Acidimicrobiia bacterium]MBT8215130.1 phosphonate ABC transporter, permease protein PhnE [Acidimicrobiia bacterium]NNF69890.1 phosphonate ABC transporter, permease protein PhnE [Acidimicrobiia bacterium]NNK91463.1 phosphonate ABC transporter, permease protein PhnE [Acidimicrobiia bacterium]
MTAIDAAAPVSGVRPQEPTSSFRFVVGAIVMGVGAAIVGAATLGIGWLWGAATAGVVYGVLWWLGLARSPIDAGIMVIAGAVSGQWFVAVLDGRAGPVDIAETTPAALGFVVFGAAVAWALRHRLTVAAAALVTVSWAAAVALPTQYGVGLGILADLGRRELREGVLQVLGSSFFTMVPLLAVLFAGSLTVALATKRAAPASVGLAVVMSVISFNMIEFSVVELFTQASQIGDLAKEFWPPTWTWPKTIGQEPTNVIIDPFIETLQIAVVGATLGCLMALPLAFMAARPTTPDEPTYWGAKSFMNVIRTIPDLFWAIIFTAAVGFNAFAGALAMVFFSLAIMSKLLSETVDSIELGPLEAARATGSRHAQVIQYAALPQVLPNYVAYALYIFELNVRASVVIGIVGAGGIGRLLNEQRNFFQWDRVMAIVIVIFVTVILIEMVSILIRRRLV